ncbi:MAG: hypothetical protein WBQ78_13210, partial [Gammaproteobacteria bacterium]
VQARIGDHLGPGGGSASLRLSPCDIIVYQIRWTRHGSGKAGKSGHERDPGLRDVGLHMAPRYSTHEYRGQEDH